MKKIMFNSKLGLEKAVLEGKKTMTRRIINPQPTCDEMKGMYWKGGYYGIGFDNPDDVYKNFISGTEYDKSCNRYHVGEVIAIARSYKDCGYDMELIIDGKLMYKHPGWKNKMLVKAGMMKQFIKITSVKVERLQDISNEDCLKEGIFKHVSHAKVYYTHEGIGNYFFETPRHAFASLIDHVSGDGTWKSDPWVWVYEFELTSNPFESWKNIFGRR